MKTMLHSIKRSITALLLLAGTTACLDKYPESAIPDKEAMQTVSDAEQIVTGIYSRLKSGTLFSGYLTLLPDIQCDMVQAVEGNTNTFGNIWRWDIRPTNPEIEAIYADLYGVIGSCNFYLDQIEAVRREVTDDTQLDELDTYTGEVYGIRALAYSELIKCFTKAYPASDAEAKNELGVVIDSTYFKKETARRSSLYDSYRFVIRDLEKAEELLDEKDDEYSNEYFSAGAVQALRARVALNMRDWERAVEYSSKLIDRSNKVFSLADARVQYSNSGMDYYSYMWAYDVSFEIIWRIGFTTTSYGGRLGSVFFNFTKDYKYFYPDYIPSDDAVRLYADNDLRKTAFFESAQTGYASGLTCNLLLKYYGNRNFMTSNNLFEVSMPKPFRLSEQYLIRAEAYCNLKEYGKASKDLSELRRYRFASGGTLNVEEKNWQDEIAAERLRELYMEGFRLNDLKRWGRGFERKMQNGAQPEGAKLKIEAENALFVWPIPQHELEAPGSQIAPNDSNK